MMNIDDTTQTTKLFLLIVCLWAITNTEVRATYCDQVYLVSPTQIDNFPLSGCDSIGTLTIRVGAVVKLDSLYPIKYIGSLDIRASQGLARIETFRGLRNVVKIDHFELEAILDYGFLDFPNADIGNLYLSNAKFSDFRELDSLRSLNSLVISNCPNFISFNGLQNLEELDLLKIDGCKRIARIILPSLVQLNSIVIKCCPIFKRIQDLGSVTTIKRLDISDDFCQDGTAEGFLSVDHDLHGIVGDGIILSRISYDEILLPNTDSISSIQTRFCGNLSNFQLKGLASGVIRDIGILGAPNLSGFNFTNAVNIMEMDQLGIDNEFDISFANQALYIGNLSLINTSLLQWPFPDIGWINNLSLTDNNQLSECCGLYQLIENRRVANFTIKNNALGCSQIFDLYNNCGKPVDDDEDGILDADDNCPDDYNKTQTDSDSDGVGDVCDNCPQLPNTNQLDTNGNKVGDACEDADYETKLSIENGDALFNSPSGLILRGVDDQCYRIVVDGDGGLRTKVVPCP